MRDDTTVMPISDAPFQKESGVPGPSVSASDRSRPRVLVVEDDQRLASLVGSILRDAHLDATCVSTLAEARALLHEPPALLVLDWNLPDGEGVALMQQVRSSYRWSHVPILMITGRRRVEEKVAGLNLGADDYLTKPFDDQELVARVSSLIRRSLRDIGANPMTGLPGNRRIDEEIRSRAAREEPFDLVYIDIDHFKPYNDRYGFARGDDAIRCLAESMVRASGPGHFLGHIGGDDFVALVAKGAGEAFAGEVLKFFEERRRSLHREEDFSRGFYLSKDREGRPREFPLLFPTAVVTAPAEGAAFSMATVSLRLSELKSAARRAGRAVFVDQGEPA